MSIVLDGTNGITTPTTTSTGEHVTSVTGFKNRIINGGMGIWQRGTTFTGIGPVYTADRFALSITGITGTVTQSTDVPNVQALYSLKVVPASNATPSEFVVRQWIEQQNIIDFAGNTVIGSAWVKCSKTSIKFRCYPFNAIGGGDSTQTITLVANTWTKISCAFSSFSAVTAWTSTPNAGGGFLDIGFVDNTAVTTADSLYITGVQLEKGSVATSFDYRPYGTELSLCQRYYQIGNIQQIGYIAASAPILVSETFPVVMRTVPTITPTFTYSINCSGGTVGGATTYNFYSYVIGTVTGGQQYALNYTASSEL